MALQPASTYVPLLCCHLLMQNHYSCWRVHTHAIRGEADAAFTAFFLIQGSATMVQLSNLNPKYQTPFAAGAIQCSCSCWSFSFGKEKPKSGGG